MRFFAPILALFAAVAIAQDRTNTINNGQTGRLTVTAGQSNTVTWTNPSSGTVTIKLQRADPAGIRPDTGYLLARVAASAETATFTIPADQVAPNTEYVYQIIDDTNSNDRENANYSAPFLVSGATGSLTTSTTATGTSATMTTVTSTGTSTSGTSTSTITRTGTTSGTATTTRTSTSASAPTTGAPNPTGAASKLGAQGGLLALMVGAIVVM